MSTARERMRLQNVGAMAEEDARVEARSGELANQKIQGMVQQKQMDNMRASRDQQFQDEARMQGQIEGMDAVTQGLGMGQEAAQGMQQQAGQANEQAMQEAAMTYVGQALEALQQGMDPQEIDAMITEGVEPELQPVVRQMLGQEMQRMNQQRQGQGGQQGAPQGQQSTAGNASEAILQQTAQLGQAQQ